MPSQLPKLLAALNDEYKVVMTAFTLDAGGAAKQIAKFDPRRWGIMFTQGLIAGAASGPINLSTDSTQVSGNVGTTLLSQAAIGPWDFQNQRGLVTTEWWAWQAAGAAAFTLTVFETFAI